MVTPRVPARRGSGAPVRGLGVVVVAQLLLRVGSAAGGLVVGSYFAALRAGGVPVTSLLLGALSGLGFFTEVVVAPLAGAGSDRRGRRVFVMVAPVLAAAGILLLPGASLLAAVPPLGLVAAVVGVSRLVEGSGSAMARRRRWGCWPTAPTGIGGGGAG